MVWHGMARHGMVWYGMVWYGIRSHQVSYTSRHANSPGKVASLLLESLITYGSGTKKSNVYITLGLSKRIPSSKFHAL